MDREQEADDIARGALGRPEEEQVLGEGRSPGISELVRVTIDTAEDAVKRFGAASGIPTELLRNPGWRSKTPDEIRRDVSALLGRIRSGTTTGVRIPVVVPLRMLRYHGKTREQRKKHHEMIAGYLSISIKEAKDLCARASAPRPKGRFTAYYHLSDEFLRRQL